VCILGHPSILTKEREALEVLEIAPLEKHSFISLVRGECVSERAVVPVVVCGLWLWCLVAKKSFSSAANISTAPVLTESYVLLTYASNHNSVFLL
jgi:hypothetical protein